MYYTYHIESMYGDPVTIQASIHHMKDLGDRETPPYEEAWIDSITHKGKQVSDEVLERYFSILHGCHMPWEAIEEMIIEDYEKEVCHEIL